MDHIYRNCQDGIYTRLHRKLTFGGTHSIASQQPWQSRQHARPDGAVPSIGIIPLEGHIPCALLDSAYHARAHDRFRRNDGLLYGRPPVVALFGSSRGWVSPPIYPIPNFHRIGCGHTRMEDSIEMIRPECPSPRISPFQGNQIMAFLVH
jgi:hypothetical protein